jgi:putative zinc finger/helix-turn-helix YgiT family protein
MMKVKGCNACQSHPLSEARWRRGAASDAVANPRSRLAHQRNGLRKVCAIQGQAITSPPSPLGSSLRSRSRRTWRFTKCCSIIPRGKRHTGSLCQDVRRALPFTSSYSFSLRTFWAEASTRASPNLTLSRPARKAMNFTTMLQPTPVEERRACEQCGAQESVVHSIVSERFPYGSGDDAAILEAHVLVWTCEACGEVYSEWEADEARHEAVCAYLDRPSPREIREFREANGLSQEEFAKLTRFGAASIKRWETGEQIPSASAAHLLQIVMMPGILEQLRAKARAKDSRLSTPRFRTPVTEDSRRCAQLFSLRPAPQKATASELCSA